MKELKAYLTFRIGEEYFAANTCYVHNIIEIPKITKIPEMPEYMLGAINMRGDVLPVIDARIKFGIKPTAISSNTCIIVMEVTQAKKQVFIGYLVDAVDEVIEFNEKAIKEPPTLGKQIKNNFITGVYSYREKFVLILNMNIIFSNGEILSVKGLLPEELVV